MLKGPFFDQPTGMREAQRIANEMCAAVYLIQITGSAIHTWFVDNVPPRDQPFMEVKANR